MSKKLIVTLLITGSCLLGFNSSVNATNYCGSWKAGELTNLGFKSVKTKGDTWHEGEKTYKVGFTRSANDYGMCDADHFHRFWRWRKISFVHAWNTNTGWYFTPL